MPAEFLQGIGQCRLEYSRRTFKPVVVFGVQQAAQIPVREESHRTGKDNKHKHHGRQEVTKNRPAVCLHLLNAFFIFYTPKKIPACGIRPRGQFLYTYPCLSAFYEALESAHPPNAR